MIPTADQVILSAREDGSAFEDFIRSLGSMPEDEFTRTGEQLDHLVEALSSFCIQMSEPCQGVEYSVGDTTAAGNSTIVGPRLRIVD